MTERFHLDPFWRLKELFKDGMKEPMATVRGYLEPVVQRALDDHAAAKRKGVQLDQDECTLLQYLVANTDGTSPSSPSVIWAHHGCRQDCAPG